MATAETAAAEASQKTEWTADVGVGLREEMAEVKTFMDLNRHVD